MVEETYAETWNCAIEYYSQPPTCNVPGLNLDCRRIRDTACLESPERRSAGSNWHESGNLYFTRLMGTQNGQTAQEPKAWVRPRCLLVCSTTAWEHLRAGSRAELRSENWISKH